MSEINEELALRIGLAARQLPDASTSSLIRVLNDALSGNVNSQSLAGLTERMLKSSCDGLLKDIDSDTLESLLKLLKGNSGYVDADLPQIDPASEGDLPNSIRVACASSKGAMLDGHFGSCRRFLVYQVNSEDYRLVDIIDIDKAPPEVDKNDWRASLLADCQILFVVSIGGPAAAKVVRSGVHPMKKGEAGPASEAIESLQQVIGENAPPWLAKVMGQAPEQRVRFDQTAEL